MSRHRGARPGQPMRLHIEVAPGPRRDVDWGTDGFDTAYGYAARCSGRLIPLRVKFACVSGAAALFLAACEVRSLAGASVIVTALVIALALKGLRHAALAYNARIEWERAETLRLIKAGREVADREGFSWIESDGSVTTAVTRTDLTEAL